MEDPPHDFIAWLAPACVWLLFSLIAHLKQPPLILW